MKRCLIWVSGLSVSERWNPSSLKSDTSGNGDWSMEMCLGEVLFGSSVGFGGWINITLVFCRFMERPVCLHQSLMMCMSCVSCLCTVSRSGWE